MKTLSKILMILMIAICIFAILPQNMVCAAEDTADSAVGVDASGALKAINTEITTNSTVEGTDGLSKLAARVVVFLQVASGIAAVIMIAVTGFRYIIETPEVKGELKKNMFPIIVGMILVFFALSIANFFLGMFNNK